MGWRDFISLSGQSGQVRRGSLQDETCVRTTNCSTDADQNSKGGHWPCGWGSYHVPRREMMESLLCLSCVNRLSSFSACTGKMHVSLAEALEVRGGPLQEEEVWAVLSQSAESLQELFHKGMQMSIQTRVRGCFLKMVVHARERTQFSVIVSLSFTRCNHRLITQTNPSRQRRSQKKQL